MASPIKRRAPQWEVKAKQQLAIWKQHLSIVMAIMQSEIDVRHEEGLQSMILEVII